MTPERKANFETVCSLIRKTQDALDRAADGMYELSWENHATGYSQGQLLMANAWIVRALEMINADLASAETGPVFPAGSAAPSIGGDSAII